MAIALTSMIKTNISQIIAQSTRHASWRSSKLPFAKSSVAGDYHNMPKRFVDKQTNFVYFRRPRMPQYEKKVHRYKNHAYYDMWRPWEREFRQLNQHGVSTRKIFVEPIREWPYFKGDRVEILKGPDKGKQGIINYIVRERNWVFVQGLNLRRRNHDFVDYLACEEQPLLINHEVKLVDPSDLQATDFEWRVDDKGEKLRVSTRTERIIPIPLQAHETMDYKEKSIYKEGRKDTSAKKANKNTFIPQAKTFEMDICDEMGIKDERVPYPMYWY